MGLCDNGVDPILTGNELLYIGIHIYKVELVLISKLTQITGASLTQVLPGQLVIEAIDALNRRQLKCASHSSILLYITDKYGLEIHSIADPIKRSVERAVARNHLIRTSVEDSNSHKTRGSFYDKFSFPGETPLRTVQTYTTKNAQGECQ